MKPETPQCPEQSTGYNLEKTRLAFVRLRSSKPASVIVFVLLGILSIVSYRVRELAAALLLFSVLFAGAMVAISILWFVERGAHNAALWLEMQMAHIWGRLAASSVHRDCYSSAHRSGPMAR